MAGKTTRITKKLAPKAMGRLKRQRKLIAKELPALVQSDRLRKEAQEEPTLSGEFRRAIHACRLSLSAIASGAGITPLILDEFLMGERTLRSDVMDRLATVLHMRFQSTS